MAYFKLTPEDLVVIHDDLDVPLWRLKIVERGGPGGHRGILTSWPPQHRGISPGQAGHRPAPSRMPTENYVLSHFPAEEAENVARLIERAAQAVVTLLAEGLAAAQTRFHGEPADLKE